VHWAKRVKAAMPQISEPNLQKYHIIETCQEEEYAFSHKNAARRERMGGWDI
jgi:hypothetical protein